jgi:uncharacterized protein (TIGR03083 family)
MMNGVTATEPDETSQARDPQRPERLLQAEHGALLPILRRTPEPDFGRPTACPAWSVRDVLAHCAAALTRVATDQLHAFTPELNDIDVAQRRDWPLPELLAELERGYLEAGPVIADAGGKLDAIALGEWVHGGDVRAALGEPLAYESEGFDDACALLTAWTSRLAVPLVEVSLRDRALRLGAPTPGRPPATLVTGRATLIRLCTGRPAEPADYQLSGAAPDELVVF